MALTSAQMAVFRGMVIRYLRHGQKSTFEIRKAVNGEWKQKVPFDDDEVGELLQSMMAAGTIELKHGKWLLVALKR